MVGEEGLPSLSAIGWDKKNFSRKKTTRKDVEFGCAIEFAVFAGRALPPSLTPVLNMSRHPTDVHLLPESVGGAIRSFALGRLTAFIALHLERSAYKSNSPTAGEQTICRRRTALTNDCSLRPNVFRASGHKRVRDVTLSAAGSRAYYAYPLEGCFSALNNVKFHSRQMSCVRFPLAVSDCCYWILFQFSSLSDRRSAQLEDGHGLICNERLRYSSTERQKQWVILLWDSKNLNQKFDQLETKTKNRACIG